MTYSGIYKEYYNARDSEFYYWGEIWSYKIMAHMLKPNNEIPLIIKRVLI